MSRSPGNDEVAATLGLTVSRTVNPSTLEILRDKTDTRVREWRGAVDMHEAPELVRAAGTVAP